MSLPHERDDHRHELVQQIAQDGFEQLGDHRRSLAHMAARRIAHERVAEQEWPVP